MSLSFPLAVCRRQTLHLLWQSPRSPPLSRPFTSRKALSYPRWVNAKAPPPASSPNSSDQESEQPSSDSESSDSPSDSSSSDDSSSSSKILPSLPQIPTPYSPLLLLPISRRPLFPGFYKAVVIRNPEVIKAVKECVRVGQGWLGVFLIKKPRGKEAEIQEDIDTIEREDQVHNVGVFAQITSVFSAQSDAPIGSTPASSDGSASATHGSEALTAVLYPHRRIRLDSIVRPDQDSPATEGTTEADGSLTSPQASLLRGFKGVTLVRVTNHPTAEEAAEAAPKDTAQIHALSTTLISLFKDIAALNPLFRDQITNFSINQVSTNVFDEPDKLADFAGAVSSGSPAASSGEDGEGSEDKQMGEGEDLQAILEETDTAKRLSKALLVLKKELINAQLQAKLARDVDGKIAKRQREYYLTEQLKGIKKELGLETDGKERLLAKFRDRAAQLKMPIEVAKVFDEEMAKLSTLEPSASEANVTRTYLEWLTTLPWGKRGKEVLDLERAKEVLDNHHWGMESVKDRVIEFVAVGKLRGGTTGTSATANTAKEEPSEGKEEKRKPPHGKILLLTGPPGIGKTSIALSIAQALSRAYYRFSVGGLTDVAEIKGHRRTYVGALPGKVVQALKRCGVDNPLVVVDEVDKIGGGRGWAGGGDPSGALLEMLDPEQNAGFLDHYLDVPIDLSNVLFVCTANTTSTIPHALLDRMEVIELSGYVTAEKKEIAQRYLIPQALEASGLVHTVAGGEKLVQITPEAVEDIIMWWCRESGVRGLKKSVEKILRKVAVEVVKQIPAEDVPETPSVSNPEAPEAGEPTIDKAVPLVIPESVKPIVITPPNLQTYLGPQLYTHDRLYSPSSPAPAGVSTGLGYLGNGSGSLMPIEVLSLPFGKGSITLSGSLGDVIKESAGLAMSWVRAHASEIGIVEERMKQLKECDVHVHMPEGAISKDGPSAGTALLSAFVSLFLNKPISTTLAMTGEISLNGRVLPVGGLKEKILAAHRGGVTKILVPAGNRAQVDEVHSSLKGGLEVVFVADASEVIKHAFGIDMAPPATSSPVTEEKI